MRSVKTWLFGAFVVAALTGTGLLVGTSMSQADPERRVEKDHWHHHDGHWSYWYQPDNRWYYTDGSNWYYNTGDAWQTYRFDKQFGREGFERGEYKVPGEDVKVVVPRHRVFRRE